MTAPHRSLRVEACEDRALPSTLFSIGHVDLPVASFASALSMTESHGRSSQDVGLESIARAFRGQDFQNYFARTFEHSFAWTGGVTIVIVVHFSNSESARQQVPPEASTEVLQPPRQFASPAEGGEDRVPTDRGKAPNVSAPAIAIPPIANALASNLPANANATSTASYRPQVELQPRVGVAGSSSNNGLGGPLVFLGVDPEVTPPTEEPVEPLPLTIPPTTSAMEETPATAISAAGFVSSAISGVLPFNLSAIEAGARDILARVGNLDVDLPESFGGGEIWWLATAALATAALVTGGVASTIGGNRARWADRRTVGFDSVLAKWGERDGGRFD